MSATAQTQPETDSPASRRPRVRLVVFSVIVAGWVAWLGWLTLTTANPPVINRVQVLASDLVLVGKWSDRQAGRFDVSRELKHGKVTGNITIQNVPAAPGTAAPDAEWVVPVRRTGDAYTVTAGQFANRPAGPQKGVAPEIDVKAQIYPATPNVFGQIAELLPAAKPL